MTRRRSAGFTLIELMITVTIVGVLVSAAYVYLKPDPQPIDVADQTASMVSEASRRAVLGGAVRDNVATALGVTARTRLIIEGGTPAVLSIEQLEEDPSPSSTAASWIEIRREALPKQITVSGWTAPAALGSSAPANPLPAGSSKEIYCESNGRCTGAIVFFAGRHKQARAVILPLGGTPVTFTSW
ncbi:MAG: prepilin-type N-terminal cleavage/methylation domain-containing protein [Kofleriaceae bacterium]